MPSPDAPKSPAQTGPPADPTSGNPKATGHRYSGFLNLNKPSGWTSHDCVAKVRRLLGMKKVGHAGTLDPAATGVLPIALGKATRLLQYLPSDKAYRAVVQFGIITDTDDLDGQILHQQSVPNLTLDEIQTFLPQFVGEIKQIPPRYSAIQVKGQRLYDLARQGKAVDVPERTVVVHDLQVLHWQPGDTPELSLSVACGAGTYIRAIARDLGAAVGTGATLASLQRTQSSGFDLDSSQSLTDITQQLDGGTFSPLPPDIGLQALPAIGLDVGATQDWCQGRRPPLAANQADNQHRIVRVVGPDNRFLGIGEVRTIDGAVVLGHKVVYA